MSRSLQLDKDGLHLIVFNAEIAIVLIMKVLTKVQIRTKLTIAVQIDSLDSSDFVSKEGNIYHLSTAKEKFLNDGKSKMSRQSRRKRIIPELTSTKCQ